MNFFMYKNNMISNYRNIEYRIYWQKFYFY